MDKSNSKFIKVDNAENWIKILELDEIRALHVGRWCGYYGVSSHTYYSRKSLYRNYLKSHDIESFAELNAMIKRDPSLIREIDIHCGNHNASGKPGYVTVTLDEPKVIDCSYSVKDDSDASGVSITHDDLTVNVSAEFKEKTLAKVLKVIQDA